MKKHTFLIVMIFSFFALCFVCCEKEPFFDKPAESFKPLDVLVAAPQLTPFADFGDVFCGVVDGKAVFHSGKIQKNFDCIDTLFFHIERYPQLTSPNYVIEETVKGLELAKLFTNREYEISFTKEIEKANVIFVWGQIGDAVPPYSILFPLSLGAAYLPTDTKANGYIYFNEGVANTSPKSLLHKMIAHEFGHYLGFRHTFLFDFACMNPRASYLTNPNDEENIKGSEVYPICN